jgi:hypothetical protein
MEDYMCSYEDYYTNDPPEQAVEYEPDTVVMIPIGNKYIDTHPDPTLAQIQYILTMLISRKERFGMVKGIVNGSQARKITNTPAANKQANRKKTARARIKKQKRAEKKFSVWIKGMNKQSTLITANTTAQYLIERAPAKCHSAM